MKLQAIHPGQICEYRSQFAMACDIFRIVSEEAGPVGLTIKKCTLDGTEFGVTTQFKVGEKVKVRGHGKLDKRGKYWRVGTVNSFDHKGIPRVKLDGWDNIYTFEECHKLRQNGAEIDSSDLVSRIQFAATNLDVFWAQHEFKYSEGRTETGMISTAKLAELLTDLKLEATDCNVDRMFAMYDCEASDLLHIDEVREFLQSTMNDYCTLNESRTQYFKPPRKGKLLVQIGLEW